MIQDKFVVKEKSMLALVDKHTEFDSYITRIRDDVQDVRQHFIKLGFHLDEIQRMKLHRRYGYAENQFYDFCSDNFGLCKSTISRYIAIWQRFAEYDDAGFSRKMWLDKKYRDYNYSQLCEMVTMSKDDITKVTPAMTVKQIRELKKDLRDGKKNSAIGGAEKQTIKQAVEKKPDDNGLKQAAEKKPDEFDETLRKKILDGLHLLKCELWIEEKRIGAEKYNKLLNQVDRLISYCL